MIILIKFKILLKNYSKLEMLTKLTEISKKS